MSSHLLVSGLMFSVAICACDGVDACDVYVIWVCIHLLVMAFAIDPTGSNKDEVIKSHFITREGTYKLMTLSEYSRPNRVPLNPQGGNNNVSSAPVRVSFLTVAPRSNRDVSPECENAEMNAVNRSGSLDMVANPGVGVRLAGQEDEFMQRNECDTSSVDELCPDRICFNVGRELYVYNYQGVKNAADLSKPIDKRIYKGTFPTCHDFNGQLATFDSCNLIVGFSAGQIQLIDPFRKDCQISKLYNEDRLTDKTRVTCLKWVPGTPHHFITSHCSGNMYVYNEELGSQPGTPLFQSFKQGEGFTIYTCKAKSTRNPIYKWTIGQGAINEFQFSGPDAKLLATVSQDGFLRIFNYHGMELVGVMRSYFGGLTCVAWSPDTKYIVMGGEDDLVSVYSVNEKRIVCRGHGHRSWVSQVAFDPYTTWLGDNLPNMDMGGSEEDIRPVSIAGLSSFTPSSGFSNIRGPPLGRSKKESTSNASLTCVCYRFGSVGHDTQLCLWDLSEDVLRPPVTRLRSSTLAHQQMSHNNTNCFVAHGGGTPEAEGSGSNASGKGSSKKWTSDGLNKKLHKRGFSLGNKFGHHHNAPSKHNHVTNENTTSNKEKHKAPFMDESLKLFGTPACPRLEEVPLIEPLIAKKIAHERLTVLAFREDCIVTACQEGFICTWARPGKSGLSHQQSINSPNPGGSPNLLPGGTIV